MRKYVISIVSVLLMLLLSGCGQIAKDYLCRYQVATGSVISDISISSVESETAPEVVTTTEPTTSEATTIFNVTTAPEPVTTPATTTPATTAETTTQSTTTAATQRKLLPLPRQRLLQPQPKLSPLN